MTNQKQAVGAAGGAQPSGTAKTGIQIGTSAAPDSYSITVVQNGPYKVTGKPPLQLATIQTDAQGTSRSYGMGKVFESKDPMFLCRCGHSKNKPYCDGSHVTAGEDLAETASFAPLLQGAKEIDGPALALTDNEKYCAFGRFCDAGQSVWNEVQLAGASHDAATRQMVAHCPGGRLMVWDEATQQPIEPAEPPTLNLIEDPSQGCSGGIMVRGGIRVISSSGEAYEVRNRQALCRCGKSSNKPFCDGTHASFKFNDGLID